MSIVDADKPIKRSRDRAEGASLCAASCNFSDASHIFFCFSASPLYLSYALVRASACAGAAANSRASWLAALISSRYASDPDFRSQFSAIEGGD
jgi:hypothetical protein